MIRFSKLTDYALMVASELARDAGVIASAAQLAGRTGVELSTVAKVLKLLAKAGVVESARGASGGYRLRVAADRLSVASVVEAMEGPLGVTGCVAVPGSCAHEGNCGLSDPMRKISRVIEAALRAVSLQSLADAPARSIARPKTSLITPLKASLKSLPKSPLQEGVAEHV